MRIFIVSSEVARVSGVCIPAPRTRLDDLIEALVKPILAGDPSGIELVVRQFPVVRR